MKTKVLLDSGAFGAHSKGSVIKLKDYISFCRKWRKWFDEVVVLDVIPGRVSIAEAAEQSMENLKVMRDEGLDVLPVYHAKEPMSVLFSLIDAGYSRIGFGGAVKTMSYEARSAWLTRCFSTLREKKLLDGLRIHGFGITSYDQLVSFPWGSVDSASWGIAAGMGSVYMPKIRRGKADFSEPPLVFGVTEKGAKLKAGFNLHTNLGEHSRRVISDYFTNVIGCDGVAGRPERFVVNAHYFQQLSNVTKVPVYLVYIPSDGDQIAALNASKVKHRLVSYLHLRSPSDEKVEGWLREHP